MRQRAVIGLVGALLVGMASVSASAEASVGPIKQVNTDNANYIWPNLTVNPSNPQHLVVASVRRTRMGTASGSCLVHVSMDAGSTWTSSTLALPPGRVCTRSPSPKVAFGKGGAVHVAYYALATSPSPMVTDPTDRNTLSYRGQGQLLLARSDDGGRTFGAPVPVMSIGEHLANHFGAALLPGVQVQHPTDPQQTNVVPVRPASGNTNAQDVALVADSDNGNVYVAWNVPLPAPWTIGGAPVFLGYNSRWLWFSRSVNGGATFSEPTPIVPPKAEIPGRDGNLLPPSLAVAGDNVYLTSAWRSCADPVLDYYLERCMTFRIVFTSSSDQGKTFGEPVSLAEIRAYNYNGGRQPRPVVAAHKSDPKRVYVVFEEESEGDLSSNIWLRRSADGGATWAKATELTNDFDPAGYPHERPALAVAPNGRVDVAWYDGRHDPTSSAPCQSFAADEPPPCSAGRDVYYAYSTDGGATFASDVRVTPASFSAATRAITANLAGHGNSSITDAALGSIGIASAENDVRLVWEQSRWGDRANTPWDLKTTTIGH